MYDQDRVSLKSGGKVVIDGADSGFKWRRRNGQLEMLDENKVHRVSHVDRKAFRLKVLDFHNGCGEFA